MQHNQRLFKHRSLFKSKFKTFFTSVNKICIRMMLNIGGAIDLISAKILRILTPLVVDVGHRIWLEMTLGDSSHNIPKPYHNFFNCS